MLGTGGRTGESSYFALFDGHGGKQCVSYLQDNLHLNILNDRCFPQDCMNAILNGVKRSEDHFLSIPYSDKSGACSTFCLFVGSLDLCQTESAS